MQTNITQTIVCMQMPSDVCQHVLMYNQATGKCIPRPGARASLLTKCDCDFEEKYQKILNFQAQGLNLIQNRHQRLMQNKVMDFFFLKTGDNETSFENKMPCEGQGRGYLLKLSSLVGRELRTLSLRSHMCR